MKAFVSYINCTCSTNKSVIFQCFCLFVSCPQQRYSVLFLLVVVANVPLGLAVSILVHFLWIKWMNVTPITYSVRQKKTMHHNQKLFILILRLSSMRKQQTFQRKMLRQKRGVKLHFLFCLLG